MEKGMSDHTRFVMDYIPRERQEKIEEYIQNMLQDKYVLFQNKEQMEEAFQDFLNDYIILLKEEDKQAILHYTGLGFRYINSILRGVWDYDKNGRLTDEIRREASESADRLRASILKVPPLSFPMVTFRGVGISTFYPSGISSLEDLKYLEGHYFYEEGFTSTSMMRETSFFAKKPEWGSNCNIEITYFIPKDSDDGVPLYRPELNVSASQNEFLINSSSLFKVLEVEVDGTTHIAQIKMMLIPEKLWNPMDYEMERKQENTLK